MDKDFRKISDRWPVFAFARDLGVVGTTKTTPVVYAVGHIRDSQVQFSNVPKVNSVRRAYYITRYGSILGMARPLYTLYVAVLTRPPVGHCTPR